MLVFVLAGIVALADQLSKAWVARFIPLGQSKVIWPGFFALTHVRNPGAAFGILGFQTWFFILLGMLALAAAIQFRRAIEAQPLLVRLGLGFALGGTIGNMVDRFRFGKVSDFLDFYYWPVFNLADIAIVCGIGLALLSLVHTKKPFTNGG